VLHYSSLGKGYYIKKYKIKKIKRNIG